MSDFTNSHEYQVGDRIAHRFKRSWLDIWWDRIAQMRWHVPTTEERVFECTSVSAGAMWPEVK